MKTLTATLLLGILTTSIPAQQADSSEATLKFRQAWWEETGKGALTAALRTYLSAANAKGPEAIRARALLRAGTLQRQLGDETGASESMHRLIDSYPAQTDIVVQARQRLAEIEGVDRRGSTVEMRHRYLFSEAAQEKVQKLIVQLSGLFPLSSANSKQSKAARKSQIERIHSVENALLAYEIGAIPALQAAAKGAQPDLALIATHLLLRLGELPPVEAILAAYDTGKTSIHPGWARQTWGWKTLIQLDEARREQLTRDLANRQGSGARILAAAAKGPEGLIKMLGTNLGGELCRDSSPSVGAIFAVIFDLGRPELNHALFELTTNTAVPLGIRREGAQAIAWQKPSLLPAKEWLAWSLHPIHITPDTDTFFNAVAQLRKQDGLVLDVILARALTSIKSNPSAGIADVMCSGLDYNAVPLQLPWTPERLQVALQITVHPNLEDADPMAQYFQKLRTSKAHSEAMVTAIFDQVVVFRGPKQAESDTSLGDKIRTFDESDDENGVETQWNRIIARQLQSRWSTWGESERLAAIGLINESGLVRLNDEYRAPIVVETLEQLSQGQSETIRAAVKAFAERARS